MSSDTWFTFSSKLLEVVFSSPCYLTFCSGSSSSSRTKLLSLSELALKGGVPQFHGPSSSPIGWTIVGANFATGLLLGMFCSSTSFDLPPDIVSRGLFRPLCTNSLYRSLMSLKSSNYARSAQLYFSNVRRAAYIFNQVVEWPFETEFQ